MVRKLKRVARLSFAYLLLGAGQAPELKTGFDDLKAGDKPAGWESGFVGDKGTPHWVVAADPAAPSKPNLLRQDGNSVYSYLVHSGTKLKDGRVECRFKVESGKEDPEAGIVFRFRDGKNYLYARANTLENNVILYRMNNGKKEAVKSVDAPVDGKKWHALRADFRGAAIKVSLDDKEVMSLTDTVIMAEGAVGVWTTADTVAAFDDFSAVPL